MKGLRPQIRPVWVRPAFFALACCSQSSYSQTDQAVSELPPMEVRDSNLERSYVIPDASTGTKTDTPLMETPLAIQVVPQQVLQDQKALTLDQALTNASGVNSGGGGGGQESIWLRGFFTTTTFRDGVRIEEYSTTGGGTLGNVNMTNVEAVEVLKGPAAALYGRLEPGGMVNVITKQPRADFYGSVEQVVGSWSHFLTALDLTGPVDTNKTLLFRVNASYDSSNSWRDNVDGNSWFLAPVLEYRYSPQTRVTLEGEFRHQFGSQDGQVVPFDPVSNKVLLVAPPTKNVLNGDLGWNTSSASLKWTHQFDDDWSIAHKLFHNEVQTPITKLYYPFDFQQNGSTWLVDRYGALTATVNKTDATVVDVIGHFDALGLNHTVLFGGDYYHTAVYFFGGNTYFGPYSSTDISNPTPANVIIDPSTYGTDNRLSTNYGIYLQDQVKLPGNVSVLAGLRYHDIRERSYTVGPPIDSPISPNPDQVDHGTTPRLGVVWRARDWFSLYANYAENIGVNNGFDYKGDALLPEGARQREVGVKTEFYDGKLTASFDLFELTKTHVAAADVAHPPFSLTIGAIRSRGAEFDLQGEVRAGWDWIASYTYDEVSVTQSTPGSPYVQGQHLDNVPRNMANLWTVYKLKGDPWNGWRIGGGVNWRGKSVANTDLVDIPSYSVWSAMAAYDFKLNGRKSLFQVNVNNLFNHFYYWNVSAYQSVAYLTYGAPRSVTASLKIEL